MKKSLEINPLQTIAPNVGIVEVPTLRMARPDSKKENRVGLRQFFEEFVLVLPKGKLIAIVLISESLLRRSTVTDGRILRDRVQSAGRVSETPPASQTPSMATLPKEDQSKNLLQVPML